MPSLHSGCGYWYLPKHIEMMVDLQRRSGAAVATASRNIHGMEGEFLYHDTFECGWEGAGGYELVFLAGRRLDFCLFGRRCRNSLGRLEM